MDSSSSQIEVELLLISNTKMSRKVKMLIARREITAKTNLKNTGRVKSQQKQISKILGELSLDFWSYLTRACAAPSGNWTQVSHVTGGYTDHYTNRAVISSSDLMIALLRKEMVLIIYFTSRITLYYSETFFLTATSGSIPSTGLGPILLWWLQ